MIDKNGIILEAGDLVRAISLGGHHYGYGIIYSNEEFLIGPGEWEYDCFYVEIYFFKYNQIYGAPKPSVIQYRKDLIHKISSKEDW